MARRGTQSSRRRQAPRSRLRPILIGALATAGTAVVGLVVADLYGGVRGSLDAPLSAVVRPATGCPGARYAVPRSSVPSSAEPGEFSSDWAYAAGGLDLRPIYFLSVQGDSSDSVVLHDLRVVGVQRVQPPDDVVGFHTCAGGGDVYPRRFKVEVTPERGSVTPTVGDVDIPGDELDPAPSFPYKVSSSDPEVFWLDVSSSCYCEWHLRLEWTSGSRSGSTEVLLAGRPFRTAPDLGLPGAPEDSFQVGWDGSVAGPS